MTWSPLRSGTTNALHDVYFFDATQGVAVGEQGLILRTTDGGAGWQGVTSGVKDTLRAVSFSGVNGISAGDSQDILYSTDSGSSWQIGQSGFFGRQALRQLSYAYAGRSLLDRSNHRGQDATVQHRYCAIIRFGC